MTPVEVCRIVVDKKSYQVVKLDKNNPINVIVLNEQAKQLACDISEEDEQSLNEIRVPKKVRGSFILDLFTASAVCQIYDAVNDANKEKLNKLNLKSLISICWSLYAGKK